MKTNPVPKIYAKHPEIRQITPKYRVFQQLHTSRLYFVIELHIRVNQCNQC